MSDPAIAAMIREVLAEELRKLGGRKALTPHDKTGEVRQEEVVIASNDDLAGFVAKLLGYARNDSALKELESGRLTFRLAGTAASTPAVSSDVVSVASGFFSERQVDQLPKGTAAVLLGKAAKLTPLARDRLRRRGIKIERTEQ